MKCHQRVIREQAALTPEPDEHLKLAAARMSNATVREITRDEAKDIILKYEWLGNLGHSIYYVGLWFGQYLAGVACFGSTEGTGVAASICGKEYANEVLTLTRGACVHWCPRNGASYLINRACKLMTEKGYHIFIAYSDEAAQEIGTVYQSSGWGFVGWGRSSLVYQRGDREVGERVINQMTRDRRGLPRKGTQADIDAWAESMRADGKVVKGSGRHLYVVKMTRAEAMVLLLEQCGGVPPHKSTPKGRYIYFAGDKRKVRELRKALKLKVLPYPKRGLDEGIAVGTTNGEQVQSLQTAPDLDEE